MIFSIICPTLNESEYIEDVIKAFLANCPQPSELYIADGGSTDDTRIIVEKWVKQHPNILLFDNVEKYVSYAFNACFALSKGRYIGLIGAHAVYPDNFFQTAYEKLTSSQCDVVGGPLNQIGKTAKGQAIAYCMSTPIGVGNTAFRTAKKEMYVDSVAFAIYKRKVLEETGLLATDLVRNQDDDLHYRINAHGFKILMTPKMQSDYYVRNNFTALFKQYFEYGLYKPLVLKRVRSGVRLRHIVPPVFVLYLIAAILVLRNAYFLIPFFLYLLLIFITSFNNKLPLKVKVYSVVGFFILHVSYGIGFLLGLGKLRS